MSRMRTLTKKKKAIIGVVVAIVVIVVLVSIFTTKTKNNENKNTTTTTTTENVAIQTSPQAEEATTQQGWGINPRLVLYFKTGLGFKEVEFTEKTFSSVNEVVALTFPEVERTVEGERQYVEPEVRLYGVPLGAYVSVTCESMVTKAEYLFVGQNDGAYQYYYWQPRMYSVSEQGEYTFKLTIKESENSTTEKVLYYKISV